MSPVVSQLSRVLAGVLALVLPVSISNASASSAAAEELSCRPQPIAAGAIEQAFFDAERSFTIASLNVHGEPRIVDPIDTWVRARSIDVLLLQEVGQPGFDGRPFAESIAGRLGFGYVYSPVRRVGDEAWQGLAVVSRFPLNEVSATPLDFTRLLFRSRCRQALAATVATPAGPLRMVNLHLDTRINSDQRVAQLTTALQALGVVDGLAMVGGDFNSMDIGWAWSFWPLPFLQRQVRAVRDVLTARGFSTPFEGTPATFRVLGFPLKLDWLYFKGLTPMDWGVDDVPLTDHEGIWAEVRAS
jgi:endonuclease/exonuclease/phosphatase family metal-dependent hydrolase